MVVVMVVLLLMVGVVGVGCNGGGDGGGGNGGVVGGEGIVMSVVAAVGITCKNCGGVTALCSHTCLSSSGW